MPTYPYGMKDLPHVTDFPRVPFARATPINNRSGQLRTKTFTVSETWVAPAGVRRLETIEGKGANGTEGTWTNRSLQVLSGVSLNTTNPGGQVLNFSTAYTTNSSNAYDSFEGSGERAAYYNFETYSTGTDDLTTISSSPRIEYVRGDGVISVGAGSGNITNSSVTSLFMAMTIEVMSGGATGTAANGFGLTFPGGVNGPATKTKFEKVTITPLASYSIVVPVGGSITITYF